MNMHACAIRKMQSEEYGLLKGFLYEAIYLPEGTPAPPQSIVEHPSLACYWEKFGTCSSDMAWCAVAAEAAGGIVGAIWCREIVGFGYVADGTPELAMSVKKEYRNQGIGKRLISAMIAGLRASGYRSVSLAVQKDNFAHKMYRKAGFRVVRETPDEYIMLYVSDNEDA